MSETEVPAAGGAAVAPEAVRDRYCAWCGRQEADGDHATCRERLRLVDPPRFCPACARRMIVQVTPAGWSARCSRHGESTSSDTGRPTG